MINSIRAHLAEFGIVAPVGRNGVEKLLYAVADEKDARIPEVARACFEALAALLGKLKAQILEFDRQINVWHRSNETSRKLDALQVLDRRSQPRWSPASPIRKRFDLGATSQLGLG